MNEIEKIKKTFDENIESFLTQVDKKFNIRDKYRRELEMRLDILEEIQDNMNENIDDLYEKINKGFKEYPNPESCLICRGEVPSNTEEYKDALLYHHLRCKKENERI